MKPFVFLIFCLIILNSYAQTDKQQLERALFNLPDVSFTDVSKPAEPFLTYDLLIRQPLDHQNPENGTFYQLVQLLHKGFKNPTVIETNGYQLSRGRNEVASHGTARIRNLLENMKNEFVGKIKEWTGLDCNLEVLKSK